MSAATIAPASAGQAETPEQRAASPRWRAYGGRSLQERRAERRAVVAIGIVAIAAGLAGVRGLTRIGGR